MTMPVLALDVRAELGEGPIWEARLNALVFVDIHERRVHVFEPASGSHRVIQTDRMVSAVTPTVDGDWLAAADLGFVRIDPATGRISPIVDVEPSGSRRRMNDGAVDPAGRFWAGSMSLDGLAGQGTLFRLDAGYAATPMVTTVTTSNGPAWSPDGRLMYYADTRTRRVDVFDFDVATGTVSSRRRFAAFDDGPGRPDGLIVDAEGGVWVALWEGSAVHRYLPSGTLDRIVPMPVRCPTKCAFGGDDLRDLYITTARAPLSRDARETDTLSGGLFHIRPGVRGQPPTPFGTTSRAAAVLPATAPARPG
jgi:sugar lactone lactonase YvrE